MTAFYDEMAETALELLEEFGANVVLNNPGTSTYDPATATTSVAGAATATVSGAEIMYRRDQVGGETVIVGDKQVVVAASDVAGVQITPPDPIWTVTLVDASVWPIKAVEPINPAGTAGAYVLLLRK